ncbi:hypothetical protein SDJN03_13885, partial [Cucurbita argyrosperma subsp. sororia]
MVFVESKLTEESEHTEAFGLVVLVLVLLWFFYLRFRTEANGGRSTKEKHKMIHLCRCSRDWRLWYILLVAVYKLLQARDKQGQ